MESEVRNGEKDPMDGVRILIGWQLVVLVV
jgi:hypothetical protein